MKKHHVKLPLLAALCLALALAAIAHAQLPAARPSWELGRDAIAPAAIQGQIACVEGVVTLDGTNSFAIPATALGTQNDYTIEFELKRAAAAKGGLTVFSNADRTNKTGIEFKYFPPDYNAIQVDINGNQTVEQRGFLGDKFDRVTVVAKDRKLTLFRNGLILAMTDEVKPSTLPLTIGGIQKSATTPYEVRHIKLYNTAIFPTGFDQTADRMRNFSGDQYFMQRAEIKDRALPRVLVVGDSISMGYRGFITEHFKGRAYVDYWVGGGWFSQTLITDDFPALRGWDGVLSNGPYQVVTWNASTLHMWNGAPGRCSEDTYPANMTRVVEHLLKAAPKTRFIWIRCTPWRTTPDTGRPTFFAERNDPIIRLNKLTDAIMARHGIPEVDLYSLCEGKFDTLPAGSKDAVHWPKEVCGQMAERIIPQIEKALPAMNKPSSGK